MTVDPAVLLAREPRRRNGEDVGQVAVVVQAGPGPATSAGLPMMEALMDEPHVEHGRGSDLGFG